MDPYGHRSDQSGNQFELWIGNKPTHPANCGVENRGGNIYY